MTTSAPSGSITPAQRWALILGSLASFMVILDMLVVSTALTTIQRSLHSSLADLEWTVNAYTLSFAVLLLPAAAVGGRIGRRRVFMIGLAVFGLASAACAMSTGVAGLIAARAVQGAGAAAVMPMALAVLNAAFPPQRRGWALGIYGSVTGLAVVLGPVIGGAVTEGLSWQWIFWINVPLALGAIPFVWSKVAEGLGTSARIDVPGLLVGAAAALSLVWGLIHASDDGWTSPMVAGTLIGGAALVVAFIAYERRATAPMLPIRLFSSASFSAGNVVIFALNGAVTATIFFTAQLFQVTGGDSPLQTGLRLLIWGVPPVLIAPRAGALADRFGERALVLAGTAAFALGVGLLAVATGDNAAYLPIAGPLVLSGIGLALALPATTKAVVSLVAPADIGIASGTFSTMRQLGAAFGVAIAGTVFASAAGTGQFVDGYRAAMAVCAALGFGAMLAGLALRVRVVPSTPAPEPVPAAAGRS